ncbi:MAG TPA: hypothetical protein VK249_29105 [Anaerolineales bacterium]|nr:hypothetical protein [Anaerolineales bacterium]
MNNRLFTILLFIGSLVGGCTSNPPLVKPEPTHAQSTNVALTPVMTDLPANSYTIIPPVQTQAPSQWELSKLCVTSYPSRPDSYQLTGVAALRSLSSKVLGLELSLLDLTDGHITKIPASNHPVDVASVSPDGKTLAYLYFNDSHAKWELTFLDAIGKVQKTRWRPNQDFGFDYWVNNHQIVIEQDSKFIVVDPFQGSQLSFAPADFPKFNAYSSHNWVDFDPTLTRAIYKDGGIDFLDLHTKAIITQIEDNYDRAPIISWQTSGERVAIVATLPVLDKMHGSPDEIFIVENNGQFRQLTHLYDNFKLFLTIDSLSWSPDGEKIAFWLHDDQGNDTLMIADVATGEVTNYCILNVRQSHFPIYFPAPIWSPDGKYLIVENRYSADANKLLVVDLHNNTAFPIAENANPVGWMVAP